MTAPKRIKAGKNARKSQVKGPSNRYREFYESWNTDYVQPALQDMVKKKTKKKNA
tara:strand:- start:1732 stop:1896 length:165 start_codon:yes stop_codon:yes gene_type:complete